MSRSSVRKITTTACRAAKMATKIDTANEYGVQLARAQGHVNGFVGGEYPTSLVSPGI